MGPSGPAGSGGSLDKVGRATHRLLPSSKGKHVCKTYGWRGQVRMHSSATGRYEGLGTVCAYPWCGAQQADPHCRCEKPGEALMERDSDAEGFAFGSWPYSLDVREVRDLVRTLNAYVKGRDTVRISYLMWHRAAAPRDPRTGAGYLDQLTNQMVERGLCCVVTLPFHSLILAGVKWDREMQTCAMMAILTMRIDLMLERIGGEYCIAQQTCPTVSIVGLGISERMDAPSPAHTSCVTGGATPAEASSGTITLDPVQLSSMPTASTPVVQAIYGVDDMLAGLQARLQADRLTAYGDGTPPGSCSPGSPAVEAKPRARAKRPRAARKPAAAKPGPRRVRAKAKSAPATAKRNRQGPSATCSSCPPPSDVTSGSLETQQGLDDFPATDEAYVSREYMRKLVAPSFPQSAAGMRPSFLRSATEGLNYDAAGRVLSQSQPQYPLEATMAWQTDGLREQAAATYEYRRAYGGGGQPHAAVPVRSAQEGLVRPDGTDMAGACLWTA
jgi:hypothetical protein